MHSMSTFFVVGGGQATGSASNTFAFGKHKGRTFAEVVESDQNYCAWALAQEKPGGALKDFVAYLQSRGLRPGAGGASQPGQLGRRPPAKPQLGQGSSSAAPAAAPGGPKLSNDTLLVCELVAAQRFAVRAERLPQVEPRGGERGPGPAGLGAPAFVPGHIWEAIGALEGAKLAAERKSWLFPLRVYDAVFASLQQLGTVEGIPEWVLRMVERAERSHCSEAPDECRLPEGLLPYQLEGVRFGMSRGGRCLIGDEMGLGKTLQALALAAQYWADWPVLVVCPAVVRWVWQEQAYRWLGGLVLENEVQVIRKGSERLDPEARMWVVSYALLASDAKRGHFAQRPDGSPHEFVIVDESHNIKEWQAARTKAVVPLVRAARRAVLLSGTPTRNAAHELHPQLCGLLPSMNAKLAEFRARYCVQQPHMLGGRSVVKVAGARNTAELHHLLNSTVMVRRLKKEVLTQLPPKRRQRVPMEVSDSKLMKDIKGEMARAGGSFSGEAVQSLFLRMAKAKVPAVKEYLEEVLERGDDKIIVFAHHRIMMDELSELLTKNLGKAGFTHMRIDGSTPCNKRVELVKFFQEDPSCRVALLSITSCSEGISLTAAGLVIFAELYWVPGAVEQAEARAHRLGTTHSSVVVEFLVVPNSPDEHIYNSLERKKKDTSLLLDGTAESLGAVAEPLLFAAARRKRPPPASDAGGQEAPAPGPKRLAAGVKREAGGDELQAPATPAAPAPAARGTAAGAGGPEEAETPPPVSQSKVDFLLMAMRTGAAEQKWG